MDTTQQLLSFQQSYPAFFRDTDPTRLQPLFRIVDSTLRRGDMHHIQQLRAIIGLDQLRQQFISILQSPRVDFPRQYIPFFMRYLQIDDPVLYQHSLDKTATNALFH